MQLGQANVAMLSSMIRKGENNTVHTQNDNVIVATKPKSILKYRWHLKHALLKLNATL